MSYKGCRNVKIIGSIRNHNVTSMQMNFVCLKKIKYIIHYAIQLRKVQNNIKLTIKLTLSHVN